MRQHVQFVLADFLRFPCLKGLEQAISRATRADADDQVACLAIATGPDVFDLLGLDVAAGQHAEDWLELADEALAADIPLVGEHRLDIEATGVIEGGRQVLKHRNQRQVGSCRRGGATGCRTRRAPSPRGPHHAAPHHLGHISHLAGIGSPRTRPPCHRTGRPARGTGRRWGAIGCGSAALGLTAVAAPAAAAQNRGPQQSAHPQMNATHVKIPQEGTNPNRGVFPLARVSSKITQRESTDLKRQTGFDSWKQSHRSTETHPIDPSD
jgi:hypothetical protein